MKQNKPKILLFDIETMANLAYVWGKYEQNVIAYRRHWYMITFAWKWLGESRTHVLGLPDFKLYKKDPTNDIELIRSLWNLFDEADIIIAHNGASFDVKKANSRFAKYGMPPPSPYKVIDTKLVARKYLKQDSNKLDDLGDYFGIGRKINTGGFELWLGCESGNMDSWNKMKKYNIQDVVLLEKVYLHLRPWMGVSHPYVGEGCPVCQSKDIQKRGFAKLKGNRQVQRLQCISCGGWHQGKPEKIL